MDRNKPTFNIIKTEEPIFFAVDNDIFEAIPAEELSASILASYFKNVLEDNPFKAHDTFFQTVLTEDSYKRFNERLYSKTNPITISMLGNIAAWLLGDEYLGGKTYGRSQVIIGFALDAWEEFGSWCLLHGIKSNIWKMPSYQLGGLVIAFLKEDKMPEGIQEIEDSLKKSDRTLHPFDTPEFRVIIKAMCGMLTAGRPKSTVTIDNVVYDSRFVPELPVEERKRQEAAAQGKAYRVPEWWRGEKANYKVAKSMMGILPKRGKEPV